VKVSVQYFKDQFKIIYRYNHGNLYFLSNKKQQQRFIGLENLLGKIKLIALATRKSETKMLNHIRVLDSFV
jgi:hypothetical protein